MLSKIFIIVLVLSIYFLFVVFGYVLNEYNFTQIKDLDSFAVRCMVFGVASYSLEQSIK